MASQQDINNQKNLNSETKETLSLEEQILQLLAQRKGINSDILSDQQDIANVIRSQTKELKFQNEERRLLRSLSSQITKIAEKTYSISKDQLGLNKTNTDLAKTQKQLDEAIVLLEQQRVKFAKEGGDLNSDIAISLRDQQKEALKLQKNLSNIASDSNRIADNLGVKTFGALSDISNAIPGLKNFSEPFNNAAEAARTHAAEQMEMIKTGKGLTKEKIKELGLTEKLTITNKKGQKSVLTGSSAAKKLVGENVKLQGTFMAGLKSIGPSITKALSPLLILNTFVTSLFEADRQVVELQKSMALSATEAVQFRSNLAGAAAATGDINITATALNRSFASLSKQFGFIAKFSNDTLITTTKLTEVVGIGAEAANNLAAASVSSGVEFESAYKNSLGISYELQRQEGVQFDLREILEETGKITGTVRANLGANIENIAKAVTQAKLFGASLDQVANAGKQLLDFESSITNELKAELLLGKNLNLERARAAALVGDQATVAAELRQQAGDFESFTNMNVIQQEALASALGMQSDQLADILFQQDIQGKTAKELRAVGKDQLADRLEQQTAQDKFNKSIEKLKDIFVDVFTAVSPILNVFADIFKIVGFIVAPFGAIISAATKLDGVLGAIVSLITAAAVAALFFNSAVTFGVGTLAILGTAGIAALLLKSEVQDAKQVNDGISLPGYGKRTLITPKGAFALNNNDTVIAGTNLFRGNDVISSPEGSLSVGADNTLLRELLEETKRANNTRREIGAKTVGAIDEQGRRQIYSS